MYTYIRVHVHVYTCTWVEHTGRAHGSCTRAVCTAIDTARRVHGPYTVVYTGPHDPSAVYTARTRPFTAMYTAVYTYIRVHGHVGAMYRAENGHHTAVYTGRVYGCVYGPCGRPVHVRVTAVYTYIHVHRPCAPLHCRVRAMCTTENARVHGPYSWTRTVCTADTRPCTCSCTRTVYADAYTVRRVHGTYTAV